MDLQLAGKHVLVAGGSRGIGFECAKEFLAEGCSVTLLGRNEERLEKAIQMLDAGQGRVRGIATDLTDWAKAKCAAEQAEVDGGGIDILINTAGAARRKPFAELEPVDWRAAIESKFLTYINVMDPVIKSMAGRRSGSIVNIIGMGGKVPITTHLAGGSANAALMLATAGLAQAYGSQGVRVNALNPSKTSTDRLAEGVDAEARQRKISSDIALSEAQAALPIGRLASAAEVAAATVFLASPRASYISGAIISMDGAARPMVV